MVFGAIRDCMTIIVRRLSTSPNRWLLTGLILFRLVNAVFLTKTYFVADEYWQSLEVAHKLVFGYGYLTWEWVDGIRGYFHPLLFAALYKALAVMRLDSVWCLTVGPRILQSLITAWSDQHVFVLARSYFSVDAAPWALYCHLLTWTSIYCMTRTLSNSLETALCIFGLSRWPWPSRKRLELAQVRKALAFAALACLVRPTAALLWLPLTLHLLYTHRQQALAILLKIVLPVATVSLLFSAVVDGICYGRVVIVQWNFLRFNFLHDLGSFYGTHPWHWYFSAGLPMLLGTTLLPMVVGIYACQQRLLAVVGLLVVCANSFVAHKEFRFLLPLLPIASVYAGRGIQVAMATGRRAWMWALVVGLTVPHIAAAFYLGVVHQAGTLSAMQFLETAASSSANSAQPARFGALFLMPCHSAPFYSHLHRNLTMEFLTCPPSLTNPGEDQVFYANPLHWLHHRDGQLPSHVVLFDVLLKDVQEWLAVTKFERCAEFFHTHFPEGRIGSTVLIYCQAVT